LDFIATRGTEPRFFLPAVLYDHDPLAGRRIGNRILLAAGLQHRIPPRSHNALDPGRNRGLHAVFSKTERHSLDLQLSATDTGSGVRVSPAIGPWISSERQWSNLRLGDGGDVLDRLSRNQYRLCAYYARNLHNLHL
jgi:hypothetical protein